MGGKIDIAVRPVWGAGSVKGIDGWAEIDTTGQLGKTDNRAKPEYVKRARAECRLQSEKGCADDRYK